MDVQNCDNCEWRTQWASRTKFPGVKAATCTYNARKENQRDLILHAGRVFNAENLAEYQPCKVWKQRSKRG